MIHAVITVAVVFAAAVLPSGRTSSSSIGAAAAAPQPLPAAASLNFPPSSLSSAQPRNNSPATAPSRAGYQHFPFAGGAVSAHPAKLGTQGVLRRCALASPLLALT